jgi:hypothetical protein
MYSIIQNLIIIYIKLLILFALLLENKWFKEIIWLYLFKNGWGNIRKCNIKNLIYF